MMLKRRNVCHQGSGAKPGSGKGGLPSVRGRTHIYSTKRTLLHMNKELRLTRISIGASVAESTGVLRIQVPAIKIGGERMCRARARARTEVCLYSAEGEVIV